MHTHRKRPIPDIREKTPLFPFFFFGGVHIFQTLFLTLSFAGLSLLFFSFSSLSRLLFQLMSRKLFLIPRSRARTSQFRNLSRFPRLLQPCDFAFAFSGLRVVDLHFVIFRRGGGGGGFLVGVFGFCIFFSCELPALTPTLTCLSGGEEEEEEEESAYAQACPPSPILSAPWPVRAALHFVAQCERFLPAQRLSSSAPGCSS